MTYPYLGFGLGLRSKYYQDILKNKPANDQVEWVEIVTEDYFVPGGAPINLLDQISDRYPTVMHGVSLSIGSADPLDLSYLASLKSLAKRIKPAWISDHLSWSGIDNTSLHDLLPLPYTEEAIDHLVGRIRQVQDYLGQRLVLENVSSYLEFKHSVMPEWVFIHEVVKRSDCLLLLDINNVYVNSVNHGFDPYQYLSSIDPTYVQQFHLAGHTQREDYRIDTHDHPINEAVWTLYAKAVEHFPKTSTLIERDDDLPEFSVLLQELQRARQIAQKASQTTQSLA